MLRLALCALLGASLACASSRTQSRCPDDAVDCFDQYLDAACRAAIDAGRFVGGHGFEPECNQYAAPTFVRLRDAIARGDVEFDRRAADACLEAGTSIHYCFEAFEARVPIGGACDHDFECIDGLCAPDVFARSRPHWTLGDCGTCIPLGEEGDDCGFTGWVGRLCADGLYCSGTAGQTCVRIVGRDESCESSSDCDVGLECVDGTCRDEVSNGDECREDVECGGFNAVCTAVCDATGELCGDGAFPCPGPGCTSRCIELYREHERECDVDEHCLGRCESGRCVNPGPGEECELGRCAPGSLCDGTTCRSTVGAGESCSAARPCSAGLICEGVCLELRAPGQTCDSSSRCVTAFDCVDGVCVLGGRVGDACESHCRSGTCIDGVCTTPSVGTECAAITTECGELVCDDTCQPPAETPEDLTGCPYDEYLDPTLGCRAICYLGR